MKNRLYFTCRLCLLGMFLFSWMAAQAQTAAEAWVRRYTSSEPGSVDYGREVEVDPDGNIIVAGNTDDGITREHILIIKYSGAGVPLWTNRFTAPTNLDHRVSGMAVDNSGNIIVTGFSTFGTAGDYAVVAYSGNGVALWTNRYNGPANGDDVARALAVDRNGNVFVTGSSITVDRKSTRLNSSHSQISY